MLAGAEVLRTVRLPRSLPRGVVVAASVALVLVVAHTVVVNLDALDDGASILKTFGRGRPDPPERARGRRPTASIRTPAAFRTRQPTPGRPGPGRDGRPRLPRAGAARHPAAARVRAPHRRRHAVGGPRRTPTRQPVRSPTGPAGLDLRPVGGTVTGDGPCATITPEAPGGRVTLTADELAVRIEAGDTPVAVAARSVADGFGPIRTWSLPPAFTLAPGATRDLGVRATGIRPWVLRMQSDTPFRVCALR